MAEITSRLAIKRRRRAVDVTVVGGGLAGLAGALALVRARRSVLVVDAGHPRNAPAAHAHGYLSRDGVPPLLATGRAEVAAYGGQAAGVMQAAASGVTAAAAINADLTAEDVSAAVAARRTTLCTSV